MATLWNVTINREAKKELDRLRAGGQFDIIKDALALIYELQEDHCPAGCSALEREPNRYRGRIAKNYRVVYRVSKQQRKILVTRIGPRSTVYKGMKDRSG